VKHCTEHQESAGPLELDKYNHFGEAYVLDVDEWDVSTHDEIDVYDGWLPMATNDACCGSSHRCQGMSGSSTTLMIPIKNHAEIWTTWYVVCWMNLGVEVRRNWGPRLGSGGNGSTEFRNSGQEESNQLGIPIFCFFSSLLFSILHYFIGSRPGTNGVGTGFYRLRMAAQWRLSFPMRRIRRMVTLSGTDRLRDLWLCTSTYAAWLLNVFFPFLFSCTVYAAQEVCA